jgi:hypothetical protein
MISDLPALNLLADNETNFESTKGRETPCAYILLICYHYITQPIAKYSAIILILCNVTVCYGCNKNEQPQHSKNSN